MAEIRSFIAIEVDHEITARLALLQEQFRQAGADVSWVRPEGMHLTLKFLGNIPEATVPAIGDALEEIARRTAPIPLTITGLGGFPNLRHPRVLWAGITTGREALASLAAAVDHRLTAFDFAREERPFRAHLTLGRVKSSRNLAQLCEMVIQHEQDYFGDMTATTLNLMQSELSPKGARYTALRQAPFMPIADEK